MCLSPPLYSALSTNVIYYFETRHQPLNRLSSFPNDGMISPLNFFLPVSYYSERTKCLHVYPACEFHNKWVRSLQEIEIYINSLNISSPFLPIRRKAFYCISNLQLRKVASGKSRVIILLSNKRNDIADFNQLRCSDFQIWANAGFEL